jgi:Ca2+-binding RTX toxin-like protein
MQLLARPLGQLEADDALSGSDPFDAAAIVTATPGETVLAINDQTGTPNADTLNGDSEGNVLSGMGGADTLNGNAGNDVLHGYSAGANGVITSTSIASGISQPVAGAAAASDPGFLYIVEKASGIIWRVNDDTGARTQFLDIPNGEFTSGGERGVLGLAFHPDYASNGRYFVFLTDTTGDLQVREYHRSSNPAVSETSFTVIWETPHPGQENHNGGWIGFSPTDGYLYISTGDGGGGDDPNNNSQNLDSLLGKILRIDVNSDGFPADANRNYAIPAGNPFVGVTGADEIWAYGLRNPWRMAFDPRNGDLYIGDVGQSQREEVDFIANGTGGLNFGWRIMEGSLPYLSGPPGSPPAGHPSLILPVYEYGRSVGTTITGGEVYTGPNANFVGQYVFSDFGSDRLFTLRMSGGVAVDAADRNIQISGPVPSNVVDFVTGTDGALYAIGIGGTIWRLDFGAGAEDVGDILSGGAGDDQIFGYAGNDALSGGADNDTLDGGIGVDYMAGGAGNDTYYVDNSGDNAVENASEGYDIIYSSVSLALTANVEELRLQGSVLYGVGNVLNNVIVGNGAANELQGQGGDDTLYGAGGIDLLYGQANNDTLYGEADNDALIGDAGNDVLDGGAGQDYLLGGIGDDTYYVDNSGDNPIESSGQGNDTIYSAVSCAMTLNVETMYLTNSAPYGVGNSQNNIIYGNAAFNELQGLGGDDTLYGGDDFDLLYGQDDNDSLYGQVGDDALIGGNGNDLLDGGVGVDYLLGGAGNDSYYVDNSGDNPIENPGGGTDTIFAATSYTITANVENLTLTGSALHANGNAENNVITGNALSNEIRGFGGADTIIGGGATDFLYGGAGADTFVYLAASDAAPATLDAIMDFEIGVDKIDLIAIRTGASDRFSFTTSGGNTYLHVDLGGNGSDDLLINIFGVTGVTAGDVLWGA